MEWIRRLFSIGNTPTKVPAKKAGRKTIPHKCKTCGEENPTQFYGSRKTKCKNCVTKDNKLKQKNKRKK